MRIQTIVYVTGQKIRDKKSCRGIEQIKKAGKGKIKPFLLKNNPEKNFQAVSVGSGARLNQTQKWSW